MKSGKVGKNISWGIFNKWSTVGEYPDKILFMDMRVGDHSYGVIKTGKPRVWKWIVMFLRLCRHHLMRKNDK
jgi:hypothetical protein